METARRRLFFATTTALALAAPLALGACTRTTFEKIPAAEVDATRRAFAEEWGNKIMKAWEKGEWPTVDDEAHPKFRAGHNQIERQQQAHAFIKKNVGAFQSMAFHEALRSTPPQGVVYRFKGTFEKGTAEVRVVLDADGKLIGHWVKPWREEMN